MSSSMSSSMRSRSSRKVEEQEPEQSGEEGEEEEKGRGGRGGPAHVLLAAPVAAWAVEESLLHLLGTAADAADVAEDNGGALHACAAAGRNGRSGGGAPRAEEIGHRRPGIRWASGRARAGPHENSARGPRRIERRLVDDDGG